MNQNLDIDNYFYKKMEKILKSKNQKTVINDYNFTQDIIDLNNLNVDKNLCYPISFNIDLLLN